MRREAAEEGEGDEEDEESDEDEENEEDDESDESEENDESGDVVNQRVSPPSFTPFRVFLKRFFELDEEDEGVVTRMRDNEGVSSMEE
ncbi:hypothetical protein BGX34_006167 [Mortierella sp. NVP85]|nr:hypothetical protein BGX34_006167 [Mortierella sp. NVP85]